MKFSVYRRRCPGRERQDHPGEIWKVRRALDLRRFSMSRGMVVMKAAQDQDLEGMP